MTELSPRARGAIEALQADTGSAAERARVRARLSALGIAVATGAAGSAVAGTAVAATLSASGAAPSTLAGSASSLGAAGVGNTGGLGAVGVGTASIAPSSATLGAASAAGMWPGAALLTKLASVPLALKAGAVVAVVAGASAVVLPTSPASPARPAHSAAVGARPAPRESTRANAAAESRGPTFRLEAPPASEAPVVAADTQDSVRPGPGGSEARPPAVSRATRTQASALAPASATERVPAPETSAAEPVGSTLAAEGALLGGALRALRAGQHARARQLLDEHEHTFGPHALLARERERMRGELSQTLR